MAFQDRSSFAAWLRDIYRDQIAVTFYDEFLLLNLLEKQKAEMEGSQIVFHLLAGRNHQVGPRAEGGRLPNVGRQTVKRAVFDPRHNYGRFGVSGPVIKASMRGGAPTPALHNEITRIVLDVRNEVSRQLYGTGSGKFTDAGTTTASTTVNVASTHLLKPGMPVTIALKSTGVIITNGAQEISDVTGPTTFTVPLAVTTSSLHAIYPVGGAATEVADAWNEAVYGLMAICDERNPSSIDAGVDNYGAIDRSVAAGAFYRGNRFHNSGTDRDLDEDIMQEAFLACRSRGGGNVDLIIMGDGQFRKYGNILKQDRRFTGYKKYHGGYIALDFNGVPVVNDPLCPPKHVFMATSSTLKLLEETPFELIDDDGSILARQTGDGAKHQFEGAAYHAGNLGCDNPPANAKIVDLNE